MQVKKEIVFRNGTRAGEDMQEKAKKTYKYLWGGKKWIS